MTDEIQQTAIEGQTQSGALKGNENGLLQEGLSTIERAEALKQFMEDGEKRIKSLFSEFETKYANQLLDGRTFGGQKPISEAEKIKKEADKIVSNFF